MRPAVYFANCLYKSGQTSGIQDTDRHGHRANGDVVADEFFRCAFIDKHRHPRLTPFRISSSAIEKRRINRLPSGFCH